jgi:hypothetical protein
LAGEEQGLKIVENLWVAAVSSVFTIIGGISLICLATFLSPRRAECTTSRRR